MSFKLSLGAVKYCRILLYYVQRSYGRIADNSAKKVNAIDKFAEINRDLNAIQATRNGREITVNGINLKLVPQRVLETIHEVMLRKDYDFFQDSSTYVMLDIGMNVGITSLCKAYDPLCNKVYSFEPLKPTYEIALQNIQLNPRLKAKIETFNFGLSNRDEELVVKFTLDHIMSISSESTFDMCFGANVSDESIKVKNASRVLGPIITTHKRNSNEKIFLKMDCEGAEFKIMTDLDENGLLKYVDIAIIEWHNRDPGPIISILSKNGFFCFLERVNVEWNIGLIKAVKISANAR